MAEIVRFAIDAYEPGETVALETRDLMALVSAKATRRANHVVAKALKRLGAGER